MINLEIKGDNGAIFETGLMRWRGICFMMAKSGFNPPRAWIHPDAVVRADAALCRKIASGLRIALRDWPDDMAALAALTRGMSEQAEPATTRSHLWEFVEFVEECGGFSVEFEPLGVLPMTKPRRSAVPESLYQEKMFP